MNIDRLEPGIYVAAVSGGVDSVTLLHVLQQRPDLKLIVAHFDHGIREASIDDRKFVHKLAKDYKLPFIYDEGKLGLQASEAKARSARYNFLNRVSKASNAKAIVTAHHQDDVIETAIINLIRGTGRKGLTALDSQPSIVRPLINQSKVDILAYARNQNLEWRDDDTNQNDRYLRNYIRRHVLSRFDSQSRQILIEIIENLKSNNQEIDLIITEELNKNSINNVIDRQWFTLLPHNISLEVMATWLRSNNIRNFDRRSLDRLVVAAKTGRANAKFDILSGVRLAVGSDNLALMTYER